MLRAVVLICSIANPPCDIDHNVDRFYGSWSNTPTQCLIDAQQTLAKRRVLLDDTEEAILFCERSYEEDSHSYAPQVPLDIPAVVPKRFRGLQH